MHYQNLYRRMKQETHKKFALPSHIRIFHADPNIPAVDILVNGQKVIKNISFKQFSPYLSLVQGKYRIDIVPVGNETPIFSALVPIMGNHTYTLAAINSDNHLQLQPILDNTHLPAGQAKIRFAHFSPDTPVVNVDLKDGDHLFENVLFKQITDFCKLALVQQILKFHSQIIKTFY